MKTINRLMTNICSECLPESRDFYIHLFDFKIDFDSDWFVHLISESKNLELGIISKPHDIVPKEAQVNPSGIYITFVVENTDAIFELAKTINCEIISEPHDTFYGQRRLLLKDPNGVVVDVSSPIPNFKFS